MAKIVKVINAVDEHGVTIMFDPENPLQYDSKKIVLESGKIEELPDGIIYVDGTLEIFGANALQVAKVMCLFLDRSFKFVTSNF